jgi:hypothetical protein
MAVTRMQSRFLERIAQFEVGVVAFELDAMDEAVVGGLIGSLVPPTDVERRATVFGVLGWKTEGGPACSYGDVCSTAPVPISKTYPDAVVGMRDGSLVVVPVGVAGPGNSWVAWYFLIFFGRMIP